LSSFNKRFPGQWGKIRGRHVRSQEEGNHFSAEQGISFKKKLGRETVGRNTGKEGTLCSLRMNKERISSAKKKERKHEKGFGCRYHHDRGKDLTVLIARIRTQRVRKETVGLEETKFPKGNVNFSSRRGIREPLEGANPRKRKA